MAISIIGYFDEEGPETGFFTPGSTTDDTSPLLQGTVTSFNSGDSVFILRDGMVQGSASVNSATGTWSYQDSGLVDGHTYNYMALQSSSAGLPIALSNACAITLSASAPPPSPPAPTSITIDHIMDNVAPVTGSVTNGMHTNDTMPVVSGSGAGPNSTVNVYDNGVKLGAATADEHGNWTYTPAEADKLLDGEHSLAATYVDAAGTESLPSSPATFTVDTVPPTALAKISAITDDTNLPNDFITSDNTLLVTVTVEGTLAADEKVRVSIDDGATWHEATLVNGNTYQYDATGTVLADGIHKFWAQVVDEAGNFSLSPGQAVEIDTVAPAALATVISITEDTGASATDFVTADNTLVVTATVNGAVGFEEKVQISLDNGATWNDARMVSDGTYQFDATRTPLADGTYTFQARLTDLAGNIGPATSQTVEIDTTAPLALATISGIVTDTGMSATDFITSDNTLVVNATVNGAVGSDEKVQMSLNNGRTWHDATLVDGNTYQYDATNTALADGTYTFQTRVIDLAGNASTAGEQTVVIDTRPPAPGKVTIDAIAGNDVLDATEAKGNVTITGTLTNIPADAASQELVVKVGNTSYTPTMDGTTWSIVVSGSELAKAVSTAGHSGVVAELTLADVAGNTTNVVESRGYTLNILPPITHTYTVGTAYAGLGYAMDTISDFNGDGYADYIVSAPGDHYGNLLCPGKSVMYLLYGSPNGLPNVSNLDNLTAAQGIRITSSSGLLAGLQGMTVSNIGDFNGDGLSDVAISSNLNYKTYVVFGQEGNTIQTLDLNKLTAVQGFSATFDCWAPASATGADVNGDGYSDLMFSNLTGGTSGTGALYVIYGHAGQQGAITYCGGTTIKGTVAGYTIESGPNGTGTVLSTVGDVNGDGYADFIATMPGNAAAGGTQPGSAYLIFGGPGGVSQANTTAVNLAKIGSGQGITIIASNYYEHLGGQAGPGGENMQADAYRAEFHSVASLGNIDGSGRNAFAIGSPGASPNNGKSTSSYTYGTVSDGAGAVYVMYGQDNWSNITLPTWNSTSKSWSGGSLNGSDGFVIYSSSFANTANGKLANASDLGFAVNSAGDVNGDGVNDFLIGAPAAYGGKGAAYLVFGEAGGLPGASAGVVDLDKLVAAGKSGVFGAAGTAIEYVGTQATGSNYWEAGSNLGTDVTGGDFSGTGLSGYAFGAWGQNGSVTTTSTDKCSGKTTTTTKVLAQIGQVEVHDGIETFLTQLISNADNSVYYAGNNPASAMPMQNGVDLIATGAGNNAWVHGIGTDTTGSASLTIQHDAVSGGRGDDHIGIIGANFTSINGGNGTDTLVFEGSGINLNLADMGLRVQNFEQFDLNNQTHTAAGDPQGLFSGLTQGNILELRLSDVMSQMGDAPNSQHMSILGDSTSTVVLDEKNWSTSSTQTVDGVTFDVYHNSTLASGNTAADLLIEHGVHVITGGIGGAGAPLMAMSAASAPLAGISAVSAPVSQEDLPASAPTFHSDNVLSTNDGNAVTSDGSTVSTGADGNHVFTSGTSGDTFNIEQGYTDTLLYKVLNSADATGGNGHDQVNGFTVGTWGTTPNADRIDLSDLLQGYKPATADTGNTVDSGKPADSGATADTSNTVDSGKPAESGATADTSNTADASKPVDSGTTTDISTAANTGATTTTGGLDQYLSVTHDNNNTTVNVDVHGTGQHAALVTLNNVDVSLETLLANNQIVV